MCFCIYGKIHVFFIEEGMTRNDEFFNQPVEVIRRIKSGIIFS